MKKSLFIIMLLAALALPAAASAVMVGLSTEKLTRGATLIVQGEVEDVASQWTPDTKFIMTMAVVAVGEVIKGRLAEQKVRVLYMGGQVDGVAMGQSDVAPLGKGEKVLLFLSPEQQYSAGAAYRMEGKAQGKYALGADNVARKHGFSVQGGDALLDTDIPLETLKKKIRAYVDQE